MWNALPMNPVPGPWPALGVLPCWIALGTAALVVLGAILVLARGDFARVGRRSAGPIPLPGASRARRLGGSAAA